ncbi:MAG: RadC family protein [Bacteroidota bacterium]|jgi:DNA repair protein RadC|nr:DNA repair protein RadC [Ignavibacteria bacterium]MCU7498179.1 DNA repair protein RadC [Ignavibacteria bacterium]MCU7511409.1 DNA repair protein RadC [Ignavibacteria bacterium]MCU7519382.1 DNA repair protein RadC [Ignavibacteria bacterium]MCU7523376.1 DNA repair protein RadC [Ignavibacteria bacterium]
MLKVKDLPLDDRPREKLILRGPQSLSDTELLAILLRVGTRGKSVIELAQELISKYASLAVLASLSVAALKNGHGIGQDKAATLVAVFEVSRRIASQSKLSRNRKITGPKDVADIFIPILRDELKERFMVLCLNSSNKIIKEEVISVGNLNSSIVHPREVFKVAIENNSANIILMHNHPSGNAEPSNEDISITKRLVEAGKLMDIHVFDHIILAGNSYLSFTEERLI